MKTQTKNFALTSKGEVRKIIIIAIESCTLNAAENKIYPVSYKGTGRFVNKTDYTFYIKQLLILQGYKFETGNDAPRGGENGNFFKVSKRAFNFIKSLTANN